MEISVFILPHHYSKGFPLSYMHTRTHTLVSLHSSAWVALEIFRRKGDLSAGREAQWQGQGCCLWVCVCQIIQEGDLPPKHLRLGLCVREPCVSAPLSPGSDLCQSKLVCEWFMGKMVCVRGNSVHSRVPTIRRCG